MHGLTPRHRRKAGSGPPASALIAWIGADPYLRDVAATVCHRHHIDAPGLSRAAKALPVCFVVAFAGAMGVMTIVSHGRPPPPIAAPLLGDPADMASPAPSILAAEASSPISASAASIPTASAPMLAMPPDRSGVRPSPAPGVRKGQPSTARGATAP